jgi:hypothetical protein
MRLEYVRDLRGRGRNPRRAGNEYHDRTRARAAMR